MSDRDGNPKLHFFQTTPDDLMSRPPLCSSLQNLESTFFLIALDRFPHALVVCASAVESAIKSVLNINPDQFINAEKLYFKAMKSYPALSSFDDDELKSFRFTRNRIVHYGFSPRDDEETAAFLLKTGFNFLSACYREFFQFDLQNGLLPDFAEQLRISMEVYDRVRGENDLHHTYCLRAFGHLVRWHIKDSLIARWELESAQSADEVGTKFDSCQRQKEKIERLFGCSWSFDCPICFDVETFICEIDENHLDTKEVRLERSVCVNCKLVIPYGCPFLTNALCRDQVEKQRSKILLEFDVDPTA